jgi:AAA+ ATPase superfamily predicted ATPase
MNIIGREEELKTLKTILGSSDPEFLVLYGRRRVGNLLSN